MKLEWEIHLIISSLGQVDVDEFVKVEMNMIEWVQLDAHLRGFSPKKWEKNQK